MVKYKDEIIDGRAFVYAYSDKGMMIEREGVQYDEANDPAEFGREYIETDIPIDIPDPVPDPDPEPMTEIEEKAKAYDILMGVSE